MPNTEDDPQRGTGRTTRMLIDAVSEIAHKRHRSAVVVGRTEADGRTLAASLRASLKHFGIPCRVRGAGPAALGRDAGAPRFVDHAACRGEHE